MSLGVSLGERLVSWVVRVNLAIMRLTHFAVLAAATATLQSRYAPCAGYGIWVRLRELIEK